MQQIRPLGETGHGEVLHSRYLLHWEWRESMTEQDIEIVLLRAHERFPGAQPRIFSDSGSAFIARDFKTFIRQAVMIHGRTSPYYPQSNSKIERFHRTLKNDAIRRFEPSDPEQARQVIARFVEHYNQMRLHSAIGYVTPADKLSGRKSEIWDSRDRKLEQARDLRHRRRQTLRLPDALSQRDTQPALRQRPCQRSQETAGLGHSEKGVEPLWGACRQRTAECGAFGCRCHLACTDGIRPPIPIESDQ